MIISLRNQRFSLTELQYGKIKENYLSSYESRALKFIQDWSGDKSIFSQTTSGSTGETQEIYLSRDQLDYSAMTTMMALDPGNELKSALLCISPDFIGGKMVIVRALSKNLDLTIVSPQGLTDALKDIKKIDLVSLVPLQIQNLLNSNPNLLNKFKVVLIGGAPMHDSLIARLGQFTSVRFIQTYGMSETASNIALKEIGSGKDYLSLIGDVHIDLDDRGCLKIKGTVTKNKWVQTNDIVELIDKKRFKWIGRADFVINTGGIKVSPESIENILDAQLQSPFFVAGLPDEVLGTKVVLIIESNEESRDTIDFSVLPKYHQPKEIFKLNTFEYTSSGKINRNLTLKKLLL